MAIDFYHDTNFHIFSVYDYKGGELRTDVNLNVMEFLINVVDEFYDSFSMKGATIDEVADYVYSNNPDRGLYAGGDDPVVELYYTNDEGLLVKLDLSDISNLLIQYLYNVDVLGNENYFIDLNFQYVKEKELPNIDFNPKTSVVIESEWDLGFNFPNNGHFGVYANEEEAMTVAYNNYVVAGFGTKEEFDEAIKDGMITIHEFDLSNDNRA